MRVARFAGDDDPRFGLIGDEDGTPTVAVLKGDPLYAGFELTGQKIPLDDVRLLAPVIPRSKVACVGKNYRDHAAESNAELPAYPTVFAKYASCIIGPGDSIVVPRVTSQVDYEAELAFVIGKRARDVSEADALSYVAGYTPFKKETEEDDKTVPGRLEGHRKLLRHFEGGLAKVRRVLANIPTYMMFDDHDVTDDWNLNPLWLDRVLTTPLGVTIVRNAFITYALFQDWGNDPLKYESPLDDKKRLLDRIAAGASS